jgi:hypothetical protein
VRGASFLPPSLSQKETAMNRTPLTADMLSKPYQFKLLGVPCERSPLTKKELEELGYAPQPRSIDFTESWQKQALIGCALNHPVFLTGASGAGKDYFAEALAFATNRPLVLLSVKPETDPGVWVGTKELRGDGLGGVDSIIHYGPLAHVAKGFEVKRANGVVVKTTPIIAVSDADRASNLEDFRQALEAQKRRYFTHPATGEKIDIADNVTFILTGNTGVDGDGGKGMIASPLDTSIVNRLKGIYVPPPSAEREARILGGMCPSLSKKEIALSVKCLRALRQAIEDASIPYEVSLRTAKMAVETAVFLLSCGEKWEDALREGFLGVVQGFCHETDNRALIEGALDPILGSPKITAGSAI